MQRIFSLGEGGLGGSASSEDQICNPSLNCSIFCCFRIQHKNKVTPYLDRTLLGLVQRTYVAGREVYSRENGFSGQPSGEIIVNNNIFQGDGI